MSAKLVEESFPALSGPSPASVAKLSRDWISVPVKSKGAGSKQPTVSATTSKAPVGRWDLPERSPSPPPQRKSKSSSSALVESPKTTQPKSAITRSESHGNEELAEFDTEAFPTLAAPAKKALPGMHRPDQPKKKNNKSPQNPSKSSLPNPTSPGNRQITETDEIAKTLFKTNTLMGREISENGALEETSQQLPLTAVISK